MYEYEIKDRLSKKLQKVSNKDHVLYEANMKIAYKVLKTLLKKLAFDKTFF